MKKILEGMKEIKEMKEEKKNNQNTSTIKSRSEIEKETERIFGYKYSFEF